MKRILLSIFYLSSFIIYAQDFKRNQNESATDFVSKNIPFEETRVIELFDKVIEDYHKHGKNDSHKSDMDYTKLNCPPFTEEEKAFIVSTRIRVGRNLADFPLGPGISRE